MRRSRVGVAASVTAFIGPAGASPTPSAITTKTGRRCGNDVEGVSWSAMPPRLRGDGNESAEDDHQPAGDLIEAMHSIAPRQP